MPQPLTCREAIALYWPKDLQNNAITVLDHENGSERPDRVGHNKDMAYGDHSSTDNGCFQVNDYWHFHYNGWTNFDDIYNASFNVKYAYQIYQRRAALNGNGWSAWYAVKGILW